MDEVISEIGNGKNSDGLEEQRVNIPLELYLK
jgi:hypothetical protein